MYNVNGLRCIEVTGRRITGVATYHSEVHFLFIDFLILEKGRISAASFATKAMTSPLRILRPLQNRSSLKDHQRTIR